MHKTPEWQSLDNTGKYELFFEMGPCYSLGWPGTRYAAQAGLKFMVFCFSTRSARHRYIPPPQPLPPPPPTHLAMNNLRARVRWASGQILVILGLIKWRQAEKEFESSLVYPVRPAVTVTSLLPTEPYFFISLQSRRQGNAPVVRPPMCVKEPPRAGYSSHYVMVNWSGQLHPDFPVLIPAVSNSSGPGVFNLGCASKPHG